MGKKVRKFMDGRMSPEELHQALAFPKGAMCSGCGRRPMVRATTFAPLAEVLSRDPIFAQMYLAADPQVNIMLTNSIVGGIHVRLATAYACKSCAPEMEKQLAKGPSWIVCDLDRGPGADKPTVGYGS